MAGPKFPHGCSVILFGGISDPDNIRKVFYGLLKAAGLRRIRFHDLRHTFASLLIQQGESLVYVKEQMGHSSVQVTVDLYGHLIPGGNKQAVDRLDGMLTTKTVGDSVPASVGEELTQETDTVLNGNATPVPPVTGQYVVQ